ncbi:MAG: molybdopterin-synthase adenylyltransferase MoeB [Acidimicrobiia bacterium]|nr:molybdopterin-synthase adenylyltransferase MoeB [Acidimicrobiia bacterium]MDH3397050.1 molybdopterin-synthase adenylyltransferase MoeB [Acidimicrobiia bacterium]
MHINYKKWITGIREEIQEISVVELAAHPGVSPIIIDVREPEEYEQGSIPGALLIPRGQLEGAIGDRVADPQTEIVLYCAVGERSALAAHSLGLLGYRNVVSLAEGFEGWKHAGQPWRVPDVLPADQRARYSRHLLLPEVGDDGQRRLLASKVVVVGAGGLGSPAAIYLAAAGIGTLGIVDFDVVDATNLQRQILHNSERLGRRKVDSARQTLAALNPDVDVVAIAKQLTADNVLNILDGYDVIVDGSDNFPTRYLVNDASLHLKKPVVHGSVFRFEGQASVFSPYAGPCYRCLFPEPPPPELAPSCAEAGVLGVVPGIIGSIQAVETIKLLLGIGAPLVGKLLTYDALDQDFRLLRFRRDPDCPACADEGRLPTIVDYDPLCVPAER